MLWDKRVFSRLKIGLIEGHSEVAFIHVLMGRNDPFVDGDDERVSSNGKGSGAIVELSIAVTSVAVQPLVVGSGPSTVDSSVGKEQQWSASRIHNCSRQ